MKTSSVSFKDYQLFLLSNFAIELKLSYETVQNKIQNLLHIKLNKTKGS